MGFDLTIYFGQITMGREILGTSKFLMDRDESLFKALGLTGAPLINIAKFAPMDALTFNAESGRVTVREDGYGAGLTYTTSPAFKDSIKEHIDLPGWNLRAIEFIQAIPANIPIVFYWH